jgi:hypothetical protein
MGELGGAQKYLYWSDRRIMRWLKDSGVELPEPMQVKISTPNFGGAVPAGEFSRSAATKSRNYVVDLFSRTFGQLLVSDLGAPAPIRFARGVGDVQFGEFVSPDGAPLRALISTSVDVGDKYPVAVCLFGSMDNYADFVAESNNNNQYGWTSSAANDVERFLASQAFDDSSLVPDRYSLAREAVKLAFRQGHHGTDDGPIEGYRREFTYGEALGDVEWCAEIYRDVDLSEENEDLDAWPECGHMRVLIGAPLWVRTPSLRNVYLYSEYSSRELPRTAPRVAVATRGQRSIFERLRSAWHAFSR